MRHAGTSLRKMRMRGIPPDTGAQLADILADLRRFNCSHNDIHSGNLLVG
eukprot:gene54639-35362_t